MKTYGLLGYPLSHSFSKKYFTEKFQKENIQDCEYQLFEYQQVTEFLQFLKTNSIKGFNITIPHKLNIIPFLDELKAEAQKVGAVNVVKISDEGKLIGYNSDYFGFQKSLQHFLSPRKKQLATASLQALILGTGGASKAVAAVLKTENIPFLFVTRSIKKENKQFNNHLIYSEITEKIIRNHQLIINTTPLGMFPKVEVAPEIPYQYLTQNHYLFDLVYNPEITLFLKKGIAQKSSVQNGLEMLHFQAEKAWEIWSE